MNRTASTRAFALNPCPADPLGRQMVYMHMSSHYRRMYSAQSVVDSAAPNKRKAPRTAAGEAPAIGAPSIGGRTLPPNFSMLKQGVTTKNNVRNARVNTSDTGRNVRSKQSMRGDEGYSGVKPPQRPKLRERPGTFLAKLDQLAKGNFGTIQTAEENAPLKPRILASNVQSKLRNSPVYHPPRPRPTNRSKLEERSKEAKQPLETPRSKVQSSPPGSSRDSAYNGGVSSGGESHLRARELELKKKRRAWTSGLPQPGTPEDLRPLGTPEGTIGDGGLVGSPAYSCFSSIVSSHGGTSDVGTNVDNRDHSGSFNEDIESQIEGESHLGETSAYEDESHYGNESPVEEIHVEVASQTEESSNSFEEDVESSRSPTSDVLTEFAPRKNGVDQITQVEDFLSSAKSSPVHTSANATTSTGSLQQTASAATSAAMVNETKSQVAKSVGTFTNDKSDVVLSEDPRWADIACVRLFHAFTSDVVKRGVLTNKALKAIFHEYVEANKPALDTDRIFQEWDKFRLDLNIPKEEHDQTANYGLGNAPLNRTNYFSPLTSQPSEIWGKTNDQRHRTNIFLPHSYRTADVATAMSSQLDVLDTELMKTIESDLNEVFDPLGIMGSLPVPNHLSPPYKVMDPVVKSVEPFPLPRRVEQHPRPVPRKAEQDLLPTGPTVEEESFAERVEQAASSPIREPVNKHPWKDVECVCEKPVCTCTTTDKINIYFRQWLQSSEEHIDHALQTLRRHSVPEAKKSSGNFRTHTPPVGRTPPISAITNAPRIVPRKNVPTPAEQINKVFPKKTVQIPRNTQNRIREETVFCLYNPNQTFTSNDSVNEGIFGSGITSAQTVFDTMSNETPSSPVTTKTQNAMSSLLTDPLFDCSELNISVASSTFTTSPNFEFNEAFAALEQHSAGATNWLNESCEAPAVNE